MRGEYWFFLEFKYITVYLFIFFEFYVKFICYLLKLYIKRMDNDFKKSIK